MKHLMKILDVSHFNKEGNLIWQQKNILNIIHASGELYCLSALFNTEETSIPDDYYVGLDDRNSPARSDTFTNLSQEPTQFGYARQPVASADGFTIELNDDDIYQATSGVITFSATGGTWGPISNVFIGTSQNNSGYLISTAQLDGDHFVSDGDQFTVRVGLTLTDAS